MSTRISRAMDEKDKGFTLIEILFVVIIIGILATIAIPTFMSQRAKAKDTSAKADVKALATEVESALTDGNPTSDVTVSAAATFTIVYSASDTQNFSSRLSSDNRAGGWIRRDSGSYCVHVATSDNVATTNNHRFRVKDGQLTKGTCDSMSIIPGDDDPDEETGG